jgi:hypothetical protein
MVIGLTIVLVLAGDAKSIQDDEQVVFFPTCGRLIEDGETWEVEVHGWIYEPEEGSIIRLALLDLIGNVAGFDDADIDGPFFRKRAGLFVCDNERGKRIQIRVGSEEHPAGESAANGHFRSVLRLARADVDRLVRRQEGVRDRLLYGAVTREGDARRFVGEVHLIPETGLSVVSDVDDTIKHSDVRNRRALLENTFLKEFKEVPGMAERYSAWARGGARFHYVSASPWQLYPALADFIRDEGFPAGSFHMKSLRLKDTTALELLDAPDELKRSYIEELMVQFPRRRFLLVGDSGEVDPEVYGEIGRRHPDQVERIFIRDVTGEKRDAPRYGKAFEGLRPETWVLFEDAAELPEALKSRH